MDKICEILTEEFKLAPQQVENTVALIDDGNTIPFIARYRKEKTGSLSDDVLRDLYARLTALRALAEKRADIIRLIDEQGKLTDELRAQLEAAKTRTELDDIYRPYRPKRRTRATIAKEKGLEPLAMLLLAQKSGEDLEGAAAEYINEEKEVLTAADALDGACDIIAEMLSDNADARRVIRSLTLANAAISTSAAKDEDSVYSGYYDFSEPLSKLANHRILAINRGEKDGFLSVKLTLDE